MADIYLNTASIHKEIKRLQKVRDELEENLDFFMRYIAVEAEDYCRKACPEGIIDHEGKHLKDTIRADYNPATKLIRITAGSYWALYVEYGTGIVGAGSPHPAPEVDWTYGTREGGWWYRVTEEVYAQMKELGMTVGENKTEGLFYAHTKGMPSRPFMYETKVFIQDLIRKEAKEFFT